MSALDQNEHHEHGPDCGCHEGAHHHPRVEFSVDDESLVVHTHELKVSEILDLVSEDPAKHYLVELCDPENITYRDVNQIVQIKPNARFISVYTGETPLS
jgi:hypothetical protein